VGNGKPRYKGFTPREPASLSAFGKDVGELEMAFGRAGSDQGLEAVVVSPFRIFFRHKDLGFGFAYFLWYFVGLVCFFSCS